MSPESTLSKTYHVFWVFAVKRRIRSNGLSEKKWTVCTRSPEKPVADSLIFLKGLDVPLHHVDRARTNA
jgi:hypothetical protein